MTVMRSHLVCTDCRHAFKKASPEPVPCPTCRVPMTDAGEQLAVPPRRDLDGWRALAVVLEAGLRFHPTSGCMPDGPGYRPRTMREVRERQAIAGRTGRSLKEVLADPDPWGE
ncbi:deoxyxylulose-5-phosphate synthase [Streptomyces sp. Da 82-17]|uniref:deoxyxylulose-5-phosphate synthase n=1 Tax=Streptomyces sp. Da 82-17 TaxID=3377116 RepID=UPI0038D3C5ED